MRAVASGAMAWVCAVLGIAALSAALGSLWPSGGIPAWPAGTLGLLALAAAAFRGDILPKSAGTLCASTAILLCSLELGGLWLVARVIP